MGERPAVFDESNTIDTNMDLRGLVDTARHRYNNFIAALENDGKVIAISQAELFNKEMPGVVDKPDQRLYVLYQLIKQEMDSRGLTKEEVIEAEELESQILRGEQLSEENEEKYRNYIRTVEDIFKSLQKKEFEGEPFTAEEIRI